MRIERTRILNQDRYLSALPLGSEFKVVAEATQVALERAGFEPGAELGDTLLPSVVGKTSRFNAEGRYRVRRDLPKENRLISSREFSRTEWHGRDPVHVTDVVDYHRMCFPRELIPPPGLEFMLVEHEGRRLIVSPELRYDAEHSETNRHAINLMLELFRSCEIVRENLARLMPPVTRRAHWLMLPPGQHPWERIERHIGAMYGGRTPAVARAVLSRQQVIIDQGPSTIYRGIAGFSDYLAYEFADLGLVVLESVRYGNAMYVFGRNWEALSRLTKAEIIQGDLAEERIVHTKDWPGKLARTLNAAQR